MPASPDRRPTARSAAKAAGPAAADLRKLVAAFSATAAKLSPAARRRLIARKAQFNKLIAEIVAEPDTDVQPLKLVPKSATEVSQGAGLGKAVSVAEGRALLAGYAAPARIEDWAGPLAGPTELERRFGVARSTLHTWQRQGAVVGLLVGVRKHAFPVEQFVDGRPVAGLGPVVEAVGEPRMAWLWLREPNPELGGASPLERLKAGAIDKVIAIARSNFADA
jgi:hypothetical protein